MVVDPRDFVTSQRMTVPVQARLKDVSAEPIAGLSGVYCFTDLGLPAGNYTAQVQPRVADRALYFDGETEFALAVVPVPGQPLKRTPVVVELLPRPAYPFTDNATLARGRLVRASDGTGVERARIFLILEGVDRGRRGRTDERGEFVVFFPPAAPEDNASAGLKDLKFRLRFEIDGQPPLLIAEQTVREGTTISLKEIQFPGI
ncbi:MAG: hypothetical protein M3461_02360 [Pseudomonadota bacterium]|nr:hypothetical protein [Pseudomonadota bacterium]